MPQQPLNLRRLQRSKGQKSQKLRSHASQFIAADSSLMEPLQIFGCPIAKILLLHNPATVIVSTTCPHWDDVPWPDGSPDISVCGRFLWGISKVRFYLLNLEPSRK
jgi:hypothetical protein